MQPQIRLFLEDLLEEQSDLGLHCLSFIDNVWRHFFLKLISISSNFRKIEAVFWVSKNLEHFFTVDSVARQRSCC